MTVPKLRGIIHNVKGNGVKRRQISIKKCRFTNRVSESVLQSDMEGDRMADKEQVELIMDHLQKAQTYKFYKALSEGNAGIGAVLRYLQEAPNDVTAGDISEFMHVSTARVAVLLKKMVSQGLITKEADRTDARITIVRLSEKGAERVRQIHDDIYQKINTLLDRIGIEKMMDFIRISDEICSVMTPPDVKF